MDIAGDRQQDHQYLSEYFILKDILFKEMDIAGDRQHHQYLWEYFILKDILLKEMDVVGEMLQQHQADVSVVHVKDALQLRNDVRFERVGVQHWHDARHC